MYRQRRSGRRPTSSIPCLIWIVSLIMPLTAGLAADPPLPTARLDGQLVKVELIAGSGDVGDGRPAKDAVLAGIGGLVVDAHGNIYLTEASRNRVRRIDAQTGTVTTVAGSGLMYNTGDSKKARQFSIQGPGPLAMDISGRYLYVGEIVGRRVRRIDIKKGEIEDLGIPEGGFGMPAGLLWTSSGLLVVDSAKGQVFHRQGKDWKALLPEGAKLEGGIRAATLDPAGRLYLVEYFSHRIVRWDNQQRVLEVVIGTGKSGYGEGPAAEAQIRTPDGIASDAAGNIYFSDMGNRRICRVDAKTGRLETLFKSGPNDSPERWTPGPMVSDARGRLYVGDLFRNLILRFTPGNPKPEILGGGGDIGDGGPAVTARFSHPGSVVSDLRGNIYIADALQHRIRRVDAQTGRITTIAGIGYPGYNGDKISARQASLSSPAEVQIDANNRLYISDYYNNRVRSVDLESGSIITIAGGAKAGEDGDGGPAPFARLLNPHAIFLDTEASRLYVASAVSANLRQIDLRNGLINKVPIDESVSPHLVFHAVTRWKDGLAVAVPRPSSNHPSGIHYLDKEGQLHALAKFPDIQFAQDVVTSPGGELFVAETGRNRILRLEENGQFEVVVEPLGRPRAINFDHHGDLLISDTFHNRILKVKFSAVKKQSAKPAP